MRKNLIDEKIKKIAGMDGPALKIFFESEYERHKNLHNPIVNWDNQKLTKQRCSSILGCMGSRVLCMFLEKLASDYKQWSFGMPDLILWREPRNKASGTGSVKFVEVKSESDTLSEQ
jgi:fanconi-associated nuclease 1